MNCSMLMMLGIILFFGGIGGVLNALMTDNGFILPKSEKNGSDMTVLRPGILGNVLIGAVAALISWGLYGPLSEHAILGGSQTASTDIGLTLASLVGAILVGVGGARWLSAEVDKTLLEAAAIDVASTQTSAEEVRQFAQATPAVSFRIARSIRGGKAG